MEQKEKQLFISDSMEWYSWASSEEHILYAVTCSSSQWHKNAAFKASKRAPLLSKHFLWSQGWPIMAIGSTVSQYYFFPKFGGSKW